MTDSYSVAIKQRVPIDILYRALHSYLKTGNIDESALLQDLTGEFSGESGINRAFIHIKAIITDTNVADFLNTHKDELIKAIDNKSDATIIGLALLNAHFSFCFYFASIIATQFRLQDEISRQLMMRLMGKKYAMNVAAEKALKISIQQLLLSNLLERINIGVYKFGNPIEIKHEISGKLWCESYFINNPLANRADTESLMFEPYFRYIKS